ncbi:hypothetical protein BCV70DRAFT_233900 [Testicularia cyperi]|uniref:Uncharacterized protein n=1 Tax=Testicularia cyperi TaxID=1882483 RepID=A0A317XG66_9BASI|nr:hypothetical protein BCV70DRAFT_233900 [Testicularia cyperi]
MSPHRLIQYLLVLVTISIAALPSLVDGAGRDMDLEEFIEAIQRDDAGLNLGEAFKPFELGEATEIEDEQFPAVTPASGSGLGSAAPGASSSSAYVELSDIPRFADKNTRIALKRFKFPKDAPGVVKYAKDKRMQFGPKHRDERWTRLWSGDRNGLQPLKKYRTMLSEAHMPITGADWHDLMMRPVVGVDHGYTKRAIYLVDGKALRFKYGLYMTPEDQRHLKPGTVGVLTGVKTAINPEESDTRKIRYNFTFRLAASLPREKLRQNFWAKPKGETSDPQ